MPYQHEVVEAHGLPYMSHTRLSETASGLVVVSEIARTIPVILEAAPKNKRLIVRHAHRQTVDTIECDDLVEFTQLGVQRWKEIVPRLGSVISVDLEYAEEVELVDEVTPGGLILTMEPSIEFRGFYANPDEMRALEAMANEITVGLGQQPSENTGQYL